MSDPFSVSRYSSKGRPDRWKVEARAPDGSRVRRFFATKVQAETFATDSNGEAVATGWQTMRLADDQRLEAQKCFDLLAPTGRSLTEAVRHYLDYLNITERSFTVADAVKRLIDEKELGKTVTRRYINELKTQFRPIVAKFGSRDIPSLSRGELKDWLFQQKHLSPVSRKNARDYLRLLFNYCIAEGAAKENPAEGIDLGKLPAPPCGILTPDAMRAVVTLASEKYPKSVAPLVLQAFAGLRSAEVGRLTWDDVNLEDGHIVVGASKAKTRSRRVIAIQPNLAAFLATLHARTGRIAGSCHLQNFVAIRAAIIKQGFAWPENALRHSFVSYRLESSSDENRTAMEAGHSVTMLHAHYKGLTNAKTAAAWFSIMPGDASGGNIVTMPAPAKVTSIAGDKAKRS